MKLTIATLALSALALGATSTNAAAAVTLTRDTERPTAATIVSAHCALAALSCAVYTVPAGKILHLTEVGFLVKDGVNQVAHVGLANFTSLQYFMTSNYDVVTDHVDTYLPAGATVNFDVSGASSIDVSIWGTLSDQ